MITRLMRVPASRQALTVAFPRTTTTTASRILRSRITSPFRTPSSTTAFPYHVRLLSTETRSAIDQAVASKPVVLFMKGTPDLPQCGFSRATIQILGMQGVDPQKFAAFNVLEDQDLRSGIKEYSDWPTIPQLYVGSEFVGGCDILMSMHQNGELSKLLEDKGVLVPAETPAEEETSKPS